MDFDVFWIHRTRIGAPRGRPRCNSDTGNAARTIGDATERGRFDDGQRTGHGPLAPPPLFPGNNSSSPLLTTPPELLALIALNLATAPPNLGPPAALLPLLRTCHRARQNPLLAAAHAFRAHCVTLQILRAGDPHALGAGRALVAAYMLLVQDSWGAAPLAASAEGLPGLPEALRPLHATPPSGMEQARTGGKNRKQLTWTGARDFALRFVRERLYEGRYGEDAADANPSWCVGWPRDTAAGAAALWVLWFFEGWDTLRAEPEPARRALMALLLPFVVAPFRYPSTLCPPHHYSVPLLPALGAGRDAITVPTLHGAYPMYPLRGRYGAAGDSCGLSEGDDEDSNDHLRAAGIQASGAHLAPPPHSFPHSDSPAPAPILFREHDDHARDEILTPVLDDVRGPHDDRVPHDDRALGVLAPPARLLFFARMQAGGRMAVPPRLARDRAEAGARWSSSGDVGPQPIRPTQEDIHEKNARPIVRFECQLAGVPLPLGVAPVEAGRADPDEGTDSYAPAGARSSAGASASPAIEPAALAAYADARAAAEAELAIPFVGADEEAGAGLEDRGGGNERWAAHAWRARLCRGYGNPSTSSSPTPPQRFDERRRRAERNREEDRIREQKDKHVGRGGAAPGRIGRVYELGSFAGLWAGTMLMPSESSYTTLLSEPGGAFPRGGLVRDDFVAAARPVYMRIAEHHSFHPHIPVPPPPPDSTTGEEGMRAGWLPRGARFVSLSANQIEIRVPTASFTPGAAPGSLEAQFGYADADMGMGVAMGGGVGGQRSEERVFIYESVPEGGVGRRRRAEVHGDGCPGCVRVEARVRWARGGGVDGARDVEMQESSSEERSSEKRSSGSSHASSSAESHDRSASSEHPSSLPQDRTSSSSQPSSSSSQDRTPSNSSYSSSPDSWPEWEAPAWAGHRFADDEGWEGACDGVQDVVFTGATDPRHGMAWHHYEYAGRVRPWDGLIGLVMRPRDRSLGLPTYFISGHLVGRDTFEGTWQMAAQDVLAPSWGGSVCFARGEE
ncbi:hypothetical protein B0H17DRAFT_1340798 [Mycena rosella]|uniref:Uncharacterized protein n=1 Tax=Mycena rosella TaxID=1033263 RepID=A0AAD7BFV5_MYCRO|nr:hypothetical protein B0H17DRAFT_1340798 [Mycena rosella]